MNALYSLLDHLIFTFAGTLVGIPLGGALGYVLSRLLRRIYLASDRALTLAVLVPWRTVLAAVLLPFAAPSIALRTLGIGAGTGIFSVAIAALGLAAAWTSGILLQRTFPRSQRVGLVAAARTITVISAALLVGFSAYGGGGLGFILWTRIALFDFDGAFTIFILILATILVFDLSVGFVQWAVRSREVRSDTEDSLSHT